MANKKDNKAGAPLSERERISVTVFGDEYASLGLTGDMSLTAATTQCRHLMGVPIPMRRKVSGGGVSALAHAIKDASPEQREKINAILAQK